MSKQSEHENQQSLTLEEVRQSLLAEIDATKQAIAELSDEQLEVISGGGNILSGIQATYQAEMDLGGDVILSTVSALTDGPYNGIKLANQGITATETMRQTLVDAARNAHLERTRRSVHRALRPKRSMSAPPYLGIKNKK